MAKLSKTTRTVIIAAAVLLVLGVVCMLLYFTKPAGEAESGSSGSSETSSDTSVVITDKEGDNVQSLSISNEKGDFTFNRLEKMVTSTDSDGNVTAETEYYWLSDQMGDLTPNSTLISAMMNSLAGLTAKNTVEESAEDLDKYGLENPLSTVKIKFDDGSEKTLLFGIENPAATNLVYFREEGGNTVYQASSYSVNKAFNSINDFVALTLTEGYNTQNPQELDYLIIERKDLDEPVEIRYMYDMDEIQQDEDSVVTTFNSHRMVTPITCEVETNAGQTICYGIYGLTAVSCVSIESNEELLKATGLDDPYCRITFKYGGKRRVLLLGDPIITSTDTEDEDTPTLTSITGYYGMIEGQPGIYSFSASSVPWYTFKVQDIMSRRPISPYIYTVDTLSIVTPDGEYNFKVTGDADNHSFKYGDTELDDDNFKAFYQHLIASIGEELFISEESYDPYITVKFTYRDEYEEIYGRKQDVLEFYQSDDRKNIISVNGSVLFKVRQIYTERLLSNLDALLNGGEVEVNW